MFVSRMAQDFADLGLSATAIDARHQARKFVTLRNPTRRTAFAQAAEIDELNVEAAYARRLAEHVRLQGAGGIPGRLAAHCRVEREDQPAAMPGCSRRAESAYLFNKGFDFRSGREPGPDFAGSPFSYRKFYTEKMELARAPCRPVRWRH
jgi:hypothetical protein